jgi:hypothetical protein
MKGEFLAVEFFKAHKKLNAAICGVLWISCRNDVHISTSYEIR